MNPDWKVFLQENGAEFIANSDENFDENSSECLDEQQLASFGNPESEMQISSQGFVA